MSIKIPFWEDSIYSEVKYLKIKAFLLPTLKGKEH